VLFLAMKFVNEVTHSERNADVSKVATIDVSGSGDAFAIPDTAEESFTVEQKGSSVQEAQGVVTKKVNDAISFLKDSGVAEKDIKTTGYNAYPEYNSSNPCYGTICPQTRTQAIIGYDVSEMVTVKIRDTSKVGAIIDGLGSRGVTGLNGPNFTVDNPDSVQADARAKAIADADAKAKILARDLHVRLVRVIRYSENQAGNYPMPMYDKAISSAGGAAAQAPEIAPGQNKYTVNVTVTYEIR
jgi:uncharacterized protein YggE